MKFQVDAVSAVRVTDHGDGDLAFRLVLNLNGLILCGGYVSAKGKKDISGDALLNGHLRAGICGRAAHGIESELGNSSQTLHAFGYLAGHTLGHDGFGPQGCWRSRVGALLGGSLPERE